MFRYIALNSLLQAFREIAESKEMQVKEKAPARTPERYEKPSVSSRAIFHSPHATERLKQDRVWFFTGLVWNRAFRCLFSEIGYESQWRETWREVIASDTLLLKKQGSENQYQVGLKKAAERPVYLDWSCGLNGLCHAIFLLFFPVLTSSDFKHVK